MQGDGTRPIHAIGAGDKLTPALSFNSTQNTNSRHALVSVALMSELNYIALSGASAVAPYIYVSESVQAVLGYEPSELLGRSSYPLFHPKDLQVLRNLHFTLLAEDGAVTIVYLRKRHKAGHWVKTQVAVCVANDTVVSSSTVISGQISKAQGDAAWFASRNDA
jgi:PAS domain S-box-containing protein